MPHAARMRHAPFEQLPTPVPAPTMENDGIPPENSRELDY
jgi:hypothetical protein